jgi:hypothetical protein
MRQHGRDDVGMVRPASAMLRQSSTSRTNAAANGSSHNREANVRKLSFY